MGAIFPVGLPRKYFVTEYLETNMFKINCSWECETQEEAERILLDNIREHGDRRTYGMYAKLK